MQFMQFMQFILEIPEDEGVYLRIEDIGSLVWLLSDVAWVISTSMLSLIYLAAAVVA